MLTLEDPVGPLIDQLCRHAGSSQRTWRLRLRSEHAARGSSIIDACRVALDPLGIRVADSGHGQIHLSSRATGFDSEKIEARLVEVASGTSIRIDALGILDELGTAGPSSESESRRTVQSVLANLDAMFNSDPLESAISLSGFDEVQRSVLNFGIGIGIGKTVASMQPREVESAVALAIRSFESRLDPESLSVSFLGTNEDDAPAEIKMLIEGRLSPALGGGELRVMTNIDVVNGRARNQFA